MWEPPWAEVILILMHFWCWIQTQQWRLEFQHFLEKKKSLEILACHLHFTAAWRELKRKSSCSSVTSPISHVGQGERTFPIFAFSSRFFLLFPDLFPLFPNFWQIFCCRGWHSASLWPPCGYATELMKLNFSKGFSNLWTILCQTQSFYSINTSKTDFCLS